MASGSHNLTTYYAKRIIGDIAANDPSTALIQTGLGVAADEWILGNSLRANNNGPKYGIIYKYDTSSVADKLEVHGGYTVSNVDTPTAWVQMNTGDVYILGKVGIGYDPNTSGNLQKLYVNGDTTITGQLYINYISDAGLDQNGSIIIGTKTSTNIAIDNDEIMARNNSVTSTLYLNNDGGEVHVGDGGITTGCFTIGGDPTDTITDKRISSSDEFYINRETGCSIIFQDDGTNKIRIDTSNYLRPETDDTLSLGSSSYRWGNIYGVTGEYSILKLHQGAAADPSLSGNARIEFDYENGQPVVISYTPNDSYRAPAGLKVMGGTSATPAWFEIEGQCACTQLRVINNSSNTSDDAMVYLENKSTDDWAMKINCAGANYGLNVDVTAGAEYGIQTNGCVRGYHIKATSGYLYSTNNSNTVQIGSQNTSFCHITNSVNIPFWFNRKVYVDGDLSPYGNNEHNCGTSSDKWAHMYCYGRVYLDEWIQFSGATGLYWPNNNDAHLYANNVTSYAGLITQGARGGYCGIQCGPNSAYMTVMGNDPHNGLYSEKKGRWIIYYHSTNDRIVIGSSSASSYRITIDGDMQVNNGWIRATGSRGWYNETYGGGMYMEDSTWVRVYGKKKFYVANTEDNAIYTSGGVCALAPNGLRVCYGNRAFIIRNDQSYTYFMPGSNGDTTGNNWASYYSYVENGNGYWHFTRAYGAVWNDYAEYRKADTIEPGRVVQDTKSGTMILVNERLAPACKIISDTYGFAIGETEEAKSPIAVSGRVLVYPYQSLDKYEIGAAVCSAPGGTVDIMTRDEVMQYPERIIGTVSEIPDYEIWKQTRSDISGNNNPYTHEVSVRGRIWIYVK